MTTPMNAPKGCAWLRVLATSDLHAHLRGFDYTRNEEVPDWGLTRLATRITEARNEAPASLLFDNGDLLQGTPLAEHFSAPECTEPHPVFVAMEAMGYDAIGMGNHEFNFGLERLEKALSTTDIPVLCANVLTHKGRHVDEDKSLRPACVVLQREVTDPETGQTENLRIGVLSVLPPQVIQWDGAHLKGRVETRDMVESATRHVAQLRAEGADIVILLAHSGIDPSGTYYGAENAAVKLAQIDGIDAMITGHTHQVFPHPSAVGHGVGQGIDAETGTVFGVPTVMPGYRGGHLGVIDLFLRRTQGLWQVASHHSEARSVMGADEDPALLRLIEPAHQATLNRINQPMGQTARPIHSYLSRVQDDLPTRLVAMAQRAAIQSRLAGSDHAHMPLLSASAPYRTGGRAGPMAYVDIPAGALTLRDANSLYPFPNTLCAVHATGAELRDWLERAASVFCKIGAGLGEQPLLDPAFPGHAMDTMYGLTYRIDLTRPAGYDANGARIAPDGAPSRIVDMMYEGTLVQDDDVFLVALNGFRAYGGGPYNPVPQDRLVLQTDACALKSVAAFLDAGGADDVGDDPCWSFVPVAGARGVFETGPGFARYEDEITRFGLRLDGLTEDGFLRVSTPLDHTSCESAA